MRNFLVPAIVLVLLVGGFLAYSFMTGDEAPTGEVALVDSPLDATYTIGSDSVTLENGSARGVSVVGDVWYGDLNNDGKEDAVVILSRGGASYAAVAQTEGVKFRGMNGIELGANITLTNMSFAENVATVEYQAEGSQAKQTKRMTIENGTVVEKTGE